MTTTTTSGHAQRAPELLGQTVVVIGGSAGIGLETARRARAEGADVIVTGRSAERLEHAGRELGAMSTAAFDATDPASLERFFDGLPTPIDHVMLSGSGPYYAPLREADLDEVRRDVERHLLLPAQIALLAVGRVRPGGSLEHAPLRLAPRRRARRPPRPAPRDPAHRARRRTRGRRRPRRPPHDQHRADGRDLRRRRRPAAHLKPCLSGHLAVRDLRGARPGTFPGAMHTREAQS